MASLRIRVLLLSGSHAALPKEQLGSTDLAILKRNMARLPSAASETIPPKIESEDQSILC